MNWSNITKSHPKIKFGGIFYWLKMGVKPHPFCLKHLSRIWTFSTFLPLISVLLMKLRMKEILWQNSITISSRSPYQLNRVKRVLNSDANILWCNEFQNYGHGCKHISCVIFLCITTISKLMINQFVKGYQLYLYESMHKFQRNFKDLCCTVFQPVIQTY